MRRFKSVAQAQRFLSVHGVIRNRFVECDGQRYYAGQDGLPSRHETRSQSISAVVDHSATNHNTI
jgi:hypothetical protein